MVQLSHQYMTAGKTIALTKWKVKLQVTQSCPTLCDPMNHRMPGLPKSTYSCPLSWWCHPTISSSVIPFCSCLQTLPESGSFQMSQLFASGGQNVQLQHQSFQWTPRTDFSKDGGLDLLAVQGTLKSLLQYHSSKASILQHSDLFIIQLSHPYKTAGKTKGLTR